MLPTQMPDASYFGDALAKAIANGQVPQSRLDDMVRRGSWFPTESERDERVARAPQPARSCSCRLRAGFPALATVRPPCTSPVLQSIRRSCAS
jgi:hypothetical protein